MDALSLLRRETIEKRNVTLDGDRIVFGELSCPKDTATNMKKGNKNEYYTIIELYYYLQNSGKRHGEYMIAARKEKIGWVARGDAKDIVDYITGKAETSKLLDENNSLIVPVTERHADVRSGKRAAEETASAAADTTKRPRLESATRRDSSSAISAELGLEKIKELRKKRAEARAKKPPRLRISEIINREVVFENRLTCLKSAKSFNNVLEMLNMSKKKAASAQSKGKAKEKTSNRSGKSYDRYDQPAAPTEGAEFGINEEGNFNTQQNEPSSAQQRKEAEQSRKKRGSKTPIIVVPSTINKHGISLYNVVSFLEGGKFQDSAQFRKDGKTKPLTVVVNKKRARTMAQYKIVDNVNGLTEEDWTRVVAVFVNGPEWELKKFPWYKKFGGVPGVLSRIRGFYLYFADQQAHKNANLWDVTVLQLDKQKPHLDATEQRRFWETLDSYTQYRTELNC